MASLNDLVLDNGLSLVTADGNRLDICSSEPGTYTDATSTASLGNKVAPSIAAPAARAGSGRQVTIAAINDGTIDGTGTVTHWALTDTVNLRLLATGTLSASQAVTAGNTFTLGAFEIGIPGPA